MKQLMLILPLIVLAGCASNVSLKDDLNVTHAVGTLTLSWLHPNSMEVMMDGKRYVGEWDSERCLNVECRGDYSNLPTVHRRHIRHGQATLKSREGDRMDCEWASHPPEVEGTCRTQDGRAFLLVEARPTK
ncbi:MAG: hypothetical protein AB1649_00705 [Chloroflexota bacterium]